MSAAVEYRVFPGDTSVRPKQFVSVGEPVDRLWDDQSSIERAHKTLHMTVMRLRQTLYQHVQRAEHPELNAHRLPPAPTLREVGDARPQPAGSRFVALRLPHPQRFTQRHNGISGAAAAQVRVREVLLGHDTDGVRHLVVG